jgi:hypothetical protein
VLNAERWRLDKENRTNENAMDRRAGSNAKGI